MNVDDRARMATAQLDRAVETRAAATDQNMIERFERFRARKDRNRRAGAIVCVAVVLAVIASVAVGTWGQPAAKTPADTGRPRGPVPLGTLTITKGGCALDASADPTVGPFTIQVVNDSDRPNTVVIFKIASEARFRRMLTLVDELQPRFGDPAHGPGHASEDARFVSDFFQYASTNETDIDAHVSLEVPGAFDPGTYGIQCAGRGRDRDASSHFVGPIDVEEGIT
jgi:hypothetical protein